jgi:hypothetical protein
MALQTSGQITLQDIAYEFDDAAPHALTEFYGAASGVPTSGEITISDFYGASASFYNGVIDGSARFEDGSSAYLSRTWGASSTGSERTWTCSFWVKVSEITTSQQAMFSAGSSGDETELEFRDYRIGFILNGTRRRWTNALFRDPSAWYHIVAVFDSTQGTESNRFKLYVNGEQITSWYSSATINSNEQGDWLQNGDNNTIAKRAGESNYLDGYIADFYCIDGTALDATSFGESKNGCWIPKAYSGSYGTNGFRLDFSQSLTADQSGNGNNWTANNMGSTDLMLDSPENNFAVWNPLYRKNANGTYSEGNCKYVGSSDGHCAQSSIGITSQDAYAEFRFLSTGQYGIVGLRNDVGDKSYTWTSTGYLYTQSGYTGISTSGYSVGDIMAIAVDADGNASLYKNGTFIRTLCAMSHFGGDTVHFMAGGGNNNNGWACNFGQDSTFQGAVTAGGNSDGNGYGDFKYSVPSGYLALCTANLPVATAVDPLSGNSPQDYFGFVSWAGNNASSRSITGMGFQPDMVYLGQLTSNGDPRFFVDVNRQSGGELLTVRGSDGNAETTNEDHYSVISLDSDGVTVGAGNSTTGGINYSGRTYGAWGWKAGGSGSSNTDGSVTSTVSVNSDIGVSILTYTTPSSGFYTYGHGLNQAPDLVIDKQRNQNWGWGAMYRPYNGGFMRINNDQGVQSGHNIFSQNGGASVLEGGVNYTHFGNTPVLTYCFHSVDGFSKIGTYSGNGSSNGTFVYTGFRPAFVLVKRTDGGYDWNIYTADRDPYNPADSWVGINTTSTEQSGSAYLDMLSNGFKWRYSGAQNSGTVLYMAFAENPFKYANAR